MKNATRKRNGKRRMNSANMENFPLDTYVEVEGITLRKDGTLDIVVLDENLPDQLREPMQTMEASNPRRRKAKRRR